MMKEKVKTYLDYLKANAGQIEDMAEAVRLNRSGNSVVWRKRLIYGQNKNAA